MLSDVATILGNGSDATAASKPKTHKTGLILRELERRAKRKRTAAAKSTNGDEAGPDDASAGDTFAPFSPTQPMF